MVASTQGPFFLPPPPFDTDSEGKLQGQKRRRALSKRWVVTKAEPIQTSGAERRKRPQQNRNQKGQKIKCVEKGEEIK